MASVAAPSMLDGQLSARQSTTTTNRHQQQRAAQSSSQKNFQKQRRQGDSSASQQRNHRQNRPLLSEAQKRRQPSSLDVQMLLSSAALIGTNRVSNHMQPYMFPRDKMVSLLKKQHEYEMQKYQEALQNNPRRATDPGAAPQVDTIESTFDLHHTWNQLNLAAMLIAVSNVNNCLVVASNPRAANGANYLAHVLGAKSCIGRYYPGTITNTNQASFAEPAFIILASATEDTQVIKESSKSNSPIIAFADSTANLEHVDVPIPCNTRGRLSIGLMMYFLARQIQRHRGLIPYDGDLENLTPDHFVQQKVTKKDSPAAVASSSSNQPSATQNSVPESQSHQDHHAAVAIGASGFGQQDFAQDQIYSQQRATNFETMSNQNPNAPPSDDWNTQTTMRGGY